MKLDSALDLNLNIIMSSAKAGKSNVLHDGIPNRQTFDFFVFFILLPKSYPWTICVFVCRHVNVFIHMWLCWYVMQDTTVQLRFCQCKCEGKAKFLRLKTYVNQGSLAGTHVGKWTAVVKIVEIFQTKYPWSMVNWQLNPEVKKMASLSHWHEMPRLQRKTNSLAAYRACL